MAVSILQFGIERRDIRALEKECQDYTSLLNHLVPDIQILGIGSNGHIGFNEPGTSFNSHTHIVNLTESTIKDNSRLFRSINDVPQKAITMGLADIMKSKEILLLASGKNKANAIKNLVNGAISEDCPASLLKLHNNLTLVIDKDAGSEL